MNFTSTNPPSPNVITANGTFATVSVNGELVSPLLFAAIATVGVDPDARQEGFSSMRDAARFGISLEPVLRLQHSLSMGVGNYSRLVGAVMFLTHILEETEASGGSWELPADLPPEVTRVINLPADLRRSSLGLMPQRLEDVTIQVLCKTVDAFVKAGAICFEDDKRPGKSGCWPVRHKVAPKPTENARKGAAKKSIPAVQHGRVIRN